MLLYKLLGLGDANPAICGFMSPQIDSNIHISKIAKECLSSTFRVYYQINGINKLESYDDLPSEVISKSSNNLKKNSSAKEGFDTPCVYCQEFDEFNCPNHYHLYSTDEASSSEIDFAAPSSTKSGKGKSKKKNKEVKKNQQGVLFNFAKLFTQ